MSVTVEEYDAPHDHHTLAQRDEKDGPDFDRKRRVRESEREIDESDAREGDDVILETRSPVESLFKGDKE